MIAFIIAIILFAKVSMKNPDDDHSDQTSNPDDDHSGQTSPREIPPMTQPSGSGFPKQIIVVVVVAVVVVVVVLLLLSLLLLNVTVSK